MSTDQPDTPDEGRTTPLPENRKTPIPDSRGFELVRKTMPAITPERLMQERSKSNVVTLASGRSVAVVQTGDDERVEIRAKSGDMIVSFRLTDEGPVFSVSNASFELAAAKSIALSAETIELKASADLKMEAGRTLVAKGRDVDVSALPGQVAIRANDDVDITGERVRLNSDDPTMPQTWEEHRARHAVRGDPFAGSVSSQPPRAPTPVPNLMSIGPDSEDY